jgi:ATP-dependent helicase/nuclease subunit B
MAEAPPPKLFGLPPGVDFPSALVEGLLQLMAGGPPEAMARVTLYLNTQRMRRRVTEILTGSGFQFLPKLRLVTEIVSTQAENTVSALRRRLELTVLLDALLTAEPALFARTSLYDLADSLAGLMDEMQDEGVSAATVAALNVADHSAHWARTQRFLAIVAENLAADTSAAAQLRPRVEAQIARWAAAPPKDPVIIAGSTGSRGPTGLLMQAIARLPNGFVVLPGFDFDLPPAVWTSMDDTLAAEDHPQFRFRHLTQALGVDPTSVQRWTGTEAPSPDRSRLISLSLRPAPVTDEWLTEGPSLPDLIPTTQDLTLIEAPSERAEALAVALILRKAAEDGVTAALISPDRNLTRRVAAALDRWGIRPDDSAGQPLALSAPGRFLRHVAGLFGRKLSSDGLLTLLKHPLSFSGDDRGLHLRLTRELELELRRNGPAFPTAERISRWAAARNEPEAVRWASHVGQSVCGLENVSNMALSAFAARHRSAAEALAAGGAIEGTGGLWDKAAGQEALAAMTELAAEAPPSCTVSPADYVSLFTAILQRREVRDAPQVRAGLMIWGTLEARVQGADLVILGGLNDGVWPALAPPDPWLNRQMRREAGLLLPERRIGLSAHDYQQAVAAPKVVLTRPLRNADAETVPSRWLNRLTNLMEGLGTRNGPEALQAMRQRGAEWLQLAAAVEAPGPGIDPAPRPSPRPPVNVRPEKLSLTQIEKLIRDPYAIYARHVLRLKKLDPLRQEPDPRLRGEVLHAILEAFLRETMAGLAPSTKETLLAITDRILEERVAWPTARAIWRARINRAADPFIAFSAGTGGEPVALEEMGAVTLTDPPFTLIGKPDRIDALPDGRLHLIDYKTGDPPGEEKQKHFEKQLLLAAAMAENGGFGALGPREVAKITYIGIKEDLKRVETDLTPDLVAQIWSDLQKLVASYHRQSQGYTARRAMFETKTAGDYDHLARFGEWDLSSLAKPEDVG